MPRLLVLFMISFSILSCSSPGGDKAEVSDAKVTASADSSSTRYSIDTENSLVTWVGSKPVGKHNGTINISSGELQVNDGKVISGKFVMDINTVQSTDKGLDPEKSSQLTDHLKSDDFFNAAVYPTSVFEIVSVDDISERAADGALKLEGATHYVTGNLALKDSVKAVSFPAIIEINESGVAATALFNINRTKWGMHYKSDKSFGNQIIHPQVEVGFSIKTL